jgi:ankyrin repeat protein
VSQTSHQQLLWNLPTSSLREFLAAGLVVNTPDDYGDYLLTVASHRLQVESVQVLLSAGADPNVLNADRDTPLLCAIDCVEHNPTAALAVVESLVRAGANLEERGYMDKTPFLKACSRSSLEMVELLVRLGADTHATVIDGGTLDGLAFAEIFNVPLEQVQFIRSLR